MRSMSDLADSSDEGEQRRKRIRQACLNCRRKKVRCGGEKPVCTFCSRLSQACIYAEDGRSRRRTSFTFGGSNEEATGLLMETIASRFASFDNRLSKIEDTLQRLEPLLTNLSALSSNLLAQPSPLTDSRIQQSHTITSTCTNDLAQPIQPAPITHPKDALPPTAALLFAADVYFRYCHNQPYSLFHEPTFRQRLVSGELPEHLVWAFLSAARRYSSFPDLAIDAPDDVSFYAGKAWETVKLPWSGGSSDEEVVAVLQTIILIVNIEHPSGSCASAYMKLGFALRLALHAKLHMPPETNHPPIFREERKRTFWSLYLQDKLITLSRERFSILRDEECRIELPCLEEAFREGREESAPTLDQFTGDCPDQEAAERCCPLALIVVMASSLNRVSNYALQANRYAQLGFPWSSTSSYASISSTLLQLEHCFGMNEDLKESLKEKCYVNGTADQHLAGPFIYARSLLHLAHCLLDHPFLIQQRLQQLKHKAPPIFLKSAWNRCRKHAKYLLELKDTKNHNILLLTSFYGYCTMIAGTIHVLALNDDDTTVREEGEEYYASAMNFLTELSYYWKHAALMANRLKRFRQQCENRRADLNPCSEKPGHSPGDLKVLWQSVDYALLSAPTRPGSPVDNDESGGLEYLTSPSRLFDFADFADLGVFPEGVDVFGTLPFLENGTFFDSSGGHGHTDLTQTMSNS